MTPVDRLRTWCMHTRYAVLPSMLAMWLAFLYAFPALAGAANANKSANFSLFGSMQNGLALMGVKNDVSKFRDEIKDIRHKIDLEEWKLSVAMTRAGQTPEPLIMEQINKALSDVQAFIITADPIVATFKATKSWMPGSGARNKLYHEQERARKYLGQIKTLAQKLSAEVATELHKYRGTMNGFAAERAEFEAKAGVDWASEIVSIRQTITELLRQKAEKKAALRVVMGGKQDDEQSDPYASWRKRIIADFKTMVDAFQAWTDSNPSGIFGETLPPLLLKIKGLVAQRAREDMAESINDETVKQQVDSAIQPPPPMTLGADGTAGQQSAVSVALKAAVSEHRAVQQQLLQTKRLAGKAPAITAAHRTAAAMQALYTELAAMPADPNVLAAREALSVAMEAHYELTTALPVSADSAQSTPDLGTAAVAAKQSEQLATQLSSAESRLVVARAQQDSLNASQGKPKHLEMREQELTVQLQTVQQALSRYSISATEPVVKIAAQRMLEQATALVGAIGSEKQNAVAKIAAEAASSTTMSAPSIVSANIPPPVLIGSDSAMQIASEQALNVAMQPQSTMVTSGNAAPQNAFNPAGSDEVLPALSPSMLAKAMPLFPLTRPAETASELRTQIREALSNISTLQSRIDHENELLGNPSVLVRLFEAIKMARMARLDYGMLVQDGAQRGGSPSGIPPQTMAAQDDALGRSIDELQRFADMQKLTQSVRSPAVSQADRPEHEALLRQHVEDQNSANAMLHCYERKLIEIEPAPRAACDQPADHNEAVRHIKNVASFLQAYRELAPNLPERVKVDEVRQTLRDAVLKVTACHPGVPTFEDTQRMLAVLRATLSYRKGQLVAAGGPDAAVFSRTLEIQRHYEDAMRLVEMASGARPMACAGPATEYDAARDDISRALRAHYALMVPPVPIDKTAAGAVDVTRVAAQAAAARRELATKLAQWPGHELPSKQEADRRAWIQDARGRITNLLGTQGLHEGARQALDAALTHLGDAERILEALPASAREDNVTQSAGPDTSALDYANPPPSTPENYEIERARLADMEREISELRSTDCAAEACTSPECRANKQTAQSAGVLKTSLTAALRAMKPGCGEYDALSTRIRELDALQMRLDPSAGRKRVSPEELAEKRETLEKQRRLVDKMAADLRIPNASASAASELTAAIDRIRADIPRMCPDSREVVQAAITGVQLDAGSPSASSMAGAMDAVAHGEHKRLAEISADKLIQQKRMEQMNILPPPDKHWPLVLKELDMRPSDPAREAALAEARNRQQGKASLMPLAGSSSPSGLGATPGLSSGLSAAPGTMYGGIGSATGNMTGGIGSIIGGIGSAPGSLSSGLGTNASPSVLPSLNNATLQSTGQPPIGSGSLSSSSSLTGNNALASPLGIGSTGQGTASPGLSKPLGSITPNASPSLGSTNMYNASGSLAPGLTAPLGSTAQNMTTP